VREAIASEQADTAILEGQFGFDDCTMPALAERIVAAADDLYGGAVAGRSKGRSSRAGSSDPECAAVAGSPRTPLQLWKNRTTDGVRRAEAGRSEARPLRQAYDTGGLR
jgi:hypothetical protein